ncbi:hypothetical protein DASC09_000360 [Saccharomycopsis crataegensis]|uniref:Uncharacterized protein n=1 Tax=Saccharomycopsis crataegensis TaxID=43959 RepID=A0AAV5QDH4_9ASCO|nr:hypothetical protein DASC09_000360 [Saccharomycopsis crataegensis]
MEDCQTYGKTFMFMFQSQYASEQREEAKDHEKINRTIDNGKQKSTDQRRKNIKENMNRK